MHSMTEFLCTTFSVGNQVDGLPLGGIVDHFGWFKFCGYQKKEQVFDHHIQTKEKLIWGLLISSIVFSHKRSRTQWIHMAFEPYGQ